eukprot:1633522-Rhodomonas_salina.3
MSECLRVYLLGLTRVSRAGATPDLKSGVRLRPASAGNVPRPYSGTALSQPASARGGSGLLRLDLQKMYGRVETESRPSARKSQLFVIDGEPTCRPGAEVRVAPGYEWDALEMFRGHVGTLTRREAGKGWHVYFPALKEEAFFLTSAKQSMLVYNASDVEEIPQVCGSGVCVSKLRCWRVLTVCACCVLCVVCVVCGLWPVFCVVCGVWCVMCGLWSVVCGLWCVWCVVCGVRCAWGWARSRTSLRTRSSTARRAGRAPTPSRRAALPTSAPRCSASVRRRRPRAVRRRRSRSRAEVDERAAAVVGLNRRRLKWDTPAGRTSSFKFSLSLSLSNSAATADSLNSERAPVAGGLSKRRQTETWCMGLSVPERERQERQKRQEGGELYQGHRAVLLLIYRESQQPEAGGAAVCDRGEHGYTPTQAFTGRNAVRLLARMIMIMSRIRVPAAVPCRIPRPSWRSWSLTEADHDSARDDSGDASARRLASFWSGLTYASASGLA